MTRRQDYERERCKRVDGGRRQRRNLHLKCFCWAKNICKPLISFLLLQIISAHHHARRLATNTPSKFSLLLSPSSRDLYVLETSFFLLPINCFLHNLTQQLKFFRCRFEIVVLGGATFGILFLLSGIRGRCAYSKRFLFLDESH